MQRQGSFTSGASPAPYEERPRPRIGRPPKSSYVSGQSAPAERERKFHPGVNVMPPSFSTAFQSGYVPSSSTVNVNMPSGIHLQTRGGARSVISPNAQALYSTYAARVKMGATSLMQQAPQTKRSRRGGQAVNYAEGADDDDLEFIDDAGQKGKDGPISINGYTPTTNIPKRPIGKTKHMYK